MKKILLPALLLISCGSYAQITPTLTAANMNPVLNDSFAAIICDTAGVGPGASGANVTWNFTGLTASSTIIPDSGIGYVMYAHIAPGYSLLSLAPGFSATTHAVISPVTSVPGASSIVNYYIEGSTATSSAGTYVDNSNNSVYTDPIDILHFPFRFLDNFSDLYSGLVTTNLGGTPINATEGGSVIVTYDAWGTLNLPGGATFSGVARVHSYQLFRDSANLFGTPVITTDTLETYTWYQPNYHSALLTIATAHTPIPGQNYKSVSYAKRQVANHEGVPYLNGIESSLMAYPNPTDGNISIAFSVPSAQQLRISLQEMTGREVAVLANKTFQGAQTITLNTGNLAKGTYLLSIKSADGTVSRKISIR